MALENTELRMLAAENAGKAPGPESLDAEDQGHGDAAAPNELALEALGPLRRVRVRRGAEARRDARRSPSPSGIADTYFNMRKTSIYGGSNEIQRNILAKMVLGL